VLPGSNGSCSSRDCLSSGLEVKVPGNCRSRRNDVVSPVSGAACRVRESPPPCVAPPAGEPVSTATRRGASEPGAARMGRRWTCPAGRGHRQCDSSSRCRARSAPVVERDAGPAPPLRGRVDSREPRSSGGMRGTRSARPRDAGKSSGDHRTEPGVAAGAGRRRSRRPGWRPRPALRARTPVGAAGKVVGARPPEAPRYGSVVSWETG